MENPSNLKTELRVALLKKRKAISEDRRKQAATQLVKLLQNRGKILSFSPMGSEINLNPLNQFLEHQGLLFLVPYKIDALIEAPLDQIDCILVPALGFDKNMHRIGYGKGYYDRFLKEIKDIPTIGIGFKEQLCETPFPIDPWDVPVKELLLV